MNIQEAKKNLDKPLLRKKSDLPADILTQKSLESYKVNSWSFHRRLLLFLFEFNHIFKNIFMFQRADEFLTTAGSEASNDS